MLHLSYSFCVSMLHSLWQAGLLLLVYVIAVKIAQHKIAPLQKRNLLFVLIVGQLLLFAGTFLFYFLNFETTVPVNLINQFLNNLAPAETISFITPYLFSIYILVVAVKLIRAFYQWYSFKKRYRAGLHKPSIDLKLFTASKAHHFGIKRKVQLWLSNNITVPVTFGFLKPVIILPVALVNQISLAQAETLILHELSHIKANDYLLNWILIVVENIFFFNPFILSLCSSIRLEREKYCDSNVIAFDYAPLLYAETLLQAQQVQQFVPQYQLAAVKGKKQLLQRIQFFVNKQNFAYYNRPAFVLPLCSLLMAAFFTMAIIFQYSLTAKTQPVITATTITPFYSPAIIEAEMPAFVTTVVESLNDENLKQIENAVKKQQPEIEKQIKKLQPLIQAVQENAAAIANEAANYAVTPVVLAENIPTKQVIVREEQSGSKNATLKVYTLSFINGEWVIIPEWMLAAKEIKADSLRSGLNDSSSINKNEE